MSSSQPRFFLLLFTLSGLLRSAVVDFESLADSALVTSQLSGLSFQNTIALASGITLNEFEHPPRSGSKVVSDNTGPITITFSTAQASVSGYFTYVKPLTMRAFNASNTQIGTVSSKAGCTSNQALSGSAGCSANERLSISAVGIVRVTITGDAGGTSFTLDDWEFSAAPAGDITITSPTEGAVLTSSVVNFAWSPAPGSGKAYDFKVYNTQTNVLELALSMTGTLTSQVYTFRSGQYRLEMRSCSPVCGQASTVAFRVQLPAFPTTAPTGISCQVVNDANQNRLNCNWTQQAGADFYFAHVVQPPPAGPGGGALTVAGTQIGANQISLLIPNGSAFFVVKGCTGDGCGPYSSGVAINPAFGSPSVPILAEPFAGSVVDAGSAVPAVTFTWNRVAGDTGSNFKYRLYVQDFSRNSAALDVLTPNNFYAANINPFTRYDALVIAVPTSGTPAQGPPSGFVVRGKSPNTPSMVLPTTFSTLPAGTVRIGWTPVLDAGGLITPRNYQYYLSGPVVREGTTQELFADLLLPAGSYGTTVRACLTGTSCTASSATGWGPWAGNAGSEGGPGSFTLQ